MPHSSIESYLEAVSPTKKAALETLRAQIKELVPGLVECISYGLPAFRLNGKVLCGFGAAAKHCAFYPWSSNIANLFPDELAGYSTSKGAIRFQPENPLPPDLVRKLVEARLREVQVKESDPG